MGEEVLNITLRLIAALAAGGIIGLERTYHGRPAGFRTHTLVCIASCLLMLVTVYEHQWFPAGGAGNGRDARHAVGLPVDRGPGRERALLALPDPVPPRDHPSGARPARPDHGLRFLDRQPELRADRRWQPLRVPHGVAHRRSPRRGSAVDPLEERALSGGIPDLPGRRLAPLVPAADGAGTTNRPAPLGEGS